jgi:hypothetical protein
VKKKVSREQSNRATAASYEMAGRGKVTVEIFTAGDGIK